MCANTFDQGLAQVSVAELWGEDVSPVGLGRQEFCKIKLDDDDGLRRSEVSPWQARSWTLLWFAVLPGREATESAAHVYEHPQRPPAPP